MIDKIHLCFALGKYHEDKKQFKNHFTIMSVGIRCKKQISITLKKI